MPLFAGWQRLPSAFATFAGKFRHRVNARMLVFITLQIHRFYKDDERPSPTRTRRATFFKIFPAAVQWSFFPRCGFLRYTDKFDDANLPGEMITTIALKKVFCGTELNITQEGIPAAIPAEACYLGWQESLTLLAKLVEAEIPDQQ